MSSDSLIWMDEELEALAGDNRLRQLREATPLAGGYVEIDGQRALNLSSNDYLGLALELADWQPPECPAGATASRLVVGNHAGYRVLEEQLAAHKETESAVVFGSGYMANVGTIAAVVGRGDTIFSDRLNHASIVDGAQLSRATLKRYRHNDLEHLEGLLSQPSRGRKLIVTDTIFSMDGDLADLRGLVALKETYGAMLMVDEAHAGGIFGDHGQGLAQATGTHGSIDIQLGTFSKGYGCYGAYVAGSQTLIDFLTNRARSLIYTTGLPPQLVAVIGESLRRAQTQPERREKLWALTRLAMGTLKEAGLDIGQTASPIIPIMVGDDLRALSISRALLAEGIALVAIRPPTVPDGTARLRLSLSAALDEAVLGEALGRIVEQVRR